MSVGHWTDPVARTGCTVVLLPPGAVASGEVRGGAPATREFALLDPTAMVDRVDAVVLTGGSAFGLAAADGVVSWLEANARGFPTAAGPVPIVVGLGLFDLLVGDSRVRPGPDQGREAADAATPWPEPVGDAAGGALGLAAACLGPVGAGAGATVGKWRGRDHARAAGLGTAVAVDGGLVVAALFAVNAFGDVHPPTGDPSAVVPAPPAAGPERWPHDGGPGAAFGNTTIGVVVTNATLGKGGCFVVAQGCHDGIARAITPAHTRVDGDAAVVAATGTMAGPASVDRVRHLAVAATEAAIRSVAGNGG